MAANVSSVEVVPPPKDLEDVPDVTHDDLEQYTDDLRDYIVTVLWPWGYDLAKLKADLFHISVGRLDNSRDRGPAARELAFRTVTAAIKGDAPDHANYVAADIVDREWHEVTEAWEHHTGDRIDLVVRRPGVFTMHEHGRRVQLGKQPGGLHFYAMPDVDKIQSTLDALHEEIQMIPSGGWPAGGFNAAFSEPLSPPRRRRNSAGAREHDKWVQRGPRRDDDFDDRERERRGREDAAHRHRVDRHREHEEHVRRRREELHRRREREKREREERIEELHRKREERRRREHHYGSHHHHHHHRRRHHETHAQHVEHELDKIALRELSDTEREDERERRRRDDDSPPPRSDSPRSRHSMSPPPRRNSPRHSLSPPPRTRESERNSL